MLLLGMIVLIWFLAGPAFAGRGRDEPAGETDFTGPVVDDPPVRERPGTGHR